MSKKGYWMAMIDVRDPERLTGSTGHFVIVEGA